jgi:hypothetical protein
MGWVWLQPHCLVCGHRKGKALPVQVMVGVVILTKEIAVEQQLYKTLSASTTKVVGIPTTFVVNYIESLLKWLISCKYLGCFFRCKATVEMVL